MPWCPKCKSEYVEGVTECAECKVPLVEEEPEEVLEFEEVPEEYIQAIEEAIKNKREIADGRILLKEASSYVRREVRYRDMKDSAIALVSVGIIGIVALLLVITGVIDLPFTFGSMIICYISFTVIFVIFLVVGFSSFKRARILKEEAIEENELTETINQWLEERFGHGQLLLSDDLDETEIYFQRCQKIKEAIEQEFEQLDESYIDALIDDVYDQIFPEERI